MQPLYFIGPNEIDVIYYQFDCPCQMHIQNPGKHPRWSFLQKFHKVNQAFRPKMRLLSICDPLVISNQILCNKKSLFKKSSAKSKKIVDLTL